MNVCQIGSYLASSQSDSGSILVVGEREAWAVSDRGRRQNDDIEEQADPTVYLPYPERLLT